MASTSAPYTTRPTLYHSGVEQANQNRNNGDDHEARRSIFHETPCTQGDCSITELNGIAPRKMDVTGALTINFGVDLPGRHPNQQITVGGLEHDNPVTDQCSCFFAGGKIDFAVGCVPSQGRCGRFENKPRSALGREVDRSDEVL